MNILKIRTSNRIKGDIGEKAARKLLRKKGFKILEKNYVALDAEIDIIAKNSEYYVFCEVKTRTKKSCEELDRRPASAVTPDKQKKIISAAKYYLSTKYDGRKVRFDIIEVLINEAGKILETCHIESAFNLNTARGR